MKQNLCSRTETILNHFCFHLITSSRINRKKKKENESFYYYFLFCIVFLNLFYIFFMNFMNIFFVHIFFTKLNEHVRFVSLCFIMNTCVRFYDYYSNNVLSI